MPSKSLRMMKFTTPAIASEPYTDEAPTVSTSMRSTAEAGIALTSAPPSAPPMCSMRRPLIRIRV